MATMTSSAEVPDQHLLDLNGCGHPMGRLHYAMRSNWSGHDARRDITSLQRLLRNSLHPATTPAEDGRLPDCLDGVRPETAPYL